MPTPEWFAVYFVGIAVIQLAMFWYLVRRSNGVTAESVPESDGEVICSQCQTSNEPRYRFCRACVAELPGHQTTAGGLPGPIRRWIQ